jgi:hypothetical protein
MITANQESETVTMQHSMPGITEADELDAEMAAFRNSADLSAEQSVELAEEEFTVIYRYLEAESGKEVAAESVVWDEPELSEGAVVHVLSAEGAKQHYTVDSMSGEETVTVYLKKARNTLWRLVVLGVLLTGSWFAIDFIVGKIF